MKLIIACAAVSVTILSIILVVALLSGPTCEDRGGHVEKRDCRTIVHRVSNCVSQTSHGACVQYVEIDVPVEVCDHVCLGARSE